MHYVLWTSARNEKTFVKAKISLKRTLLWWDLTVCIATFESKACVQASKHAAVSTRFRRLDVKSGRFRKAAVRTVAHDKVISRESRHCRVVRRRQLPLRCQLRAQSSEPGGAVCLHKGDYSRGILGIQTSHLPNAPQQIDDDHSVVFAVQCL